MNGIILVQWLFQKTIGQKQQTYRSGLEVWRNLPQIIDHGQFNLRAFSRKLRQIFKEFRENLFQTWF